MTGIEEEARSARPLSRMRAFPNPFSSRSGVQFTLERRGAVSCRIYDAAGNQVAVLADRVMDAGHHVVGWVAADVSPGTYFVELRTPAGTTCARLVKAQ